MTHSTIRHNIRTQIRPLPQVATYPTSRAGPADLATDLRQPGEATSIRSGDVNHCFERG